MLVTTDNATIQIQSGNVAKHAHPKTDEIQYIIKGSGAMWLGNERKEFKPGTLIIIPKGTAHGGTIVPAAPSKPLRSRFRHSREMTSFSSTDPAH